MPESETIVAKGGIFKLLIACSITMLAVSTVFMTQPIFLEISESFKIDITQARFSFSVVSLFYAASFFFIGPAVDKYSLPTVSVTGVSSLSLMVLFASYINHFGLFTFIMGLIGFCAALIPAAMFPYVATSAPQKKVGLYVGSIVASATLGVILGRVSMGILTSVAGWRFSFRIFTIVMILFLFVTFLSLVKNQNKKPNNTFPLFAMYKNSIRIMLDSKAILLLLAGFALFFGFLGMITFLTYRLTEPPFSFSAGEIGWISFAGLTAIIAPFSGIISQKTEILKIIFPSLLVCLLSLQFMGWFQSVFLILLGLLFLFLGVYSCQPLIFLLIGKNVLRESIGSASSLYILFCIGGGSLSSIMLGSVWNRFGWPGITVVCTFSILISLLLMITTRIKTDNGKMCRF